MTLPLTHDQIDAVITLVQHAIDTGRRGTDVPTLTASGITYNVLDTLGMLSTPDAASAPLFDQSETMHNGLCIVCGQDVEQCVPHDQHGMKMASDMLSAHRAGDHLTCHYLSDCNDNLPPDGAEVAHLSDQSAQRVQTLVNSARNYEGQMPGGTARELIGSLIGTIVNLTDGHVI
jgi:hypothetical protein